MSLLARYKMQDNAASSTISDSSGNSYDAALSADNTDDAGVSVTGPGGALPAGIYLPGAARHVPVTDSTLLTTLSGEDNFSVAFWAKGDSATYKVNSLAILIDDSGGSTTGLWAFYVGDSFQGQGERWQFDIDNDRIDETGATYDRDEWNHFAFVSDGDDKTVYRNGVSVGTVNHAASLPTIADVKIGYQESLGVQFMDGSYADVRFYNHAISSDEISAIMAQVNGTEITLQPDDDFKTIVEAADAGTTFNLEAGTYNISATEVPDDVHFQGPSSGTALITADPGDPGDSVLTFSGTNVLSDISVTAENQGHALALKISTAATVTLNDCIISGQHDCMSLAVSSGTHRLTMNGGQVIHNAWDGIAVVSSNAIIRLNRVAFSCDGTGSLGNPKKALYVILNGAVSSDITCVGCSFTNSATGGDVAELRTLHASAEIIARFYASPVDADEELQLTETAGTVRVFADAACGFNPASFTTSGSPEFIAVSPLGPKVGTKLRTHFSPVGDTAV